MSAASISARFEPARPTAQLLRALTRRWLTAYPTAVWIVAALIIILSYFRLGAVLPATINLGIVLLIGFFFAAARLYPAQRKLFYSAACLPFIPPLALCAADVWAVRSHVQWLKDQPLPIGGSPTGILFRSAYDRPLTDCRNLIAAGISPVFCEGIDFYEDHKNALVQYTSVQYSAEELRTTEPGEPERRAAKCKSDPDAFDFGSMWLHVSDPAPQLPAFIPTVTKDAWNVWSRSPRRWDSHGEGYDIDSGWFGKVRWEAFSPFVTVPLPLIAEQRAERFGLLDTDDRPRALGWLRYRVMELRPLGSLAEFLTKALPNDLPTAGEENREKADREFEEVRRNLAEGQRQREQNLPTPVPPAP
jgi:hypothetical protein